MNYKGNFRTIQAIKASEDGKLPAEIQVLPVGEWNTIPYGPFKVTAEHLRQMIANYQLGTRKAIPVDVDHDGGKAAGWINNLSAKDDGLYADVEWTPYGQQLLGDKIYKLFSPEFSLSYVDPEYSTEHGAVFIAGSLTNRPLFKELSYITASETPLTGGADVVILLAQEKTMNLEDIKTKKLEDLTPEELDLLKVNVAELSEEDKAKFGLVEESEEKAEEATETEEVKVEEEVKDEPKVESEEAQPEVDVKASESVTISASEFATIKALAEEGRKAKETLVAKEAEETIAKFVCNDKGGKILDKDRKAFTDFYLKCSDEQKADFKKLLEVLPNKMVAGEIGTNNEHSFASAKDEIESKVLEKIKASESSNRKISYSEGLKLVTKENPELIKKYALDSKPE